MGRLKLTSPGILLILATAAAGGIFLLDVFYLGPHVTEQKEHALRQEAVQAERKARLASLGEQNSLLRLCRAQTQDPKLWAALGRDWRDEAPRALPTATFGPSNIHVAWLTDADGKMVEFWSQEPSAADSKPVMRQQVATAIEPIVHGGETACVGLLPVANDVMVFARQEIIHPDRPGAPLGELWLASKMDKEFLGSLQAALGVDVTFVHAESLPPGTLSNASGSQVSWPGKADRLAVAWIAQDAAGNTLGYFRADVPVVHVRLQAISARRMILIMLSLSAGLVLLVIMGTHILISGPVIRLLQRLQEIESGENPGTRLTDNLHGEPLVLARRLESAFDQLAHMSQTDQLTGLANRRHFEDVLRCFYLQARRYNRPMSVMMIDIDFFKAVNDTGGHPAGDDVLKIVAAAVEEACRKADLPARLGGDEFAVLLPETAAEDAYKVAERIHKTVCHEPITVKDMSIGVTLSIGIADLNSGQMDSPEALVSLVDRALYAAKELGRNRIVQAHDLTGLNFSEGNENHERIDVLCQKLAGLDTEFKGLFLRAISEVVELLAQRSPNMAAHTHNVQHYSVLIAQEMELPERVIKRIRIAAALHDIGMIAMPDSILLSDKRLTETELEIVRRHPLLSVKIMEGMQFLEQEIPTVRYHHERYDGKGYPEGIAGAEIPLTARILAVADAFDAMTSERTFRPAKSRQESLRELRLGAEGQFDPAVVEAFLAVAEKLGEELLEIPDSPLSLENLTEEVPAPTA